MCTPSVLRQVAIGGRQDTQQQFNCETASDFESYTQRIAARETALRSRKLCLRLPQTTESCLGDRRIIRATPDIIGEFVYRRG